MPTAAELIAQRLYQAGCRLAFGVPGGEVLTLMDALDKAGIEFRLAKHENAAGFMAEGTHHATGAPAVLLATLGPGVANAVNVIANAHQDRVPLVFLSGRVDEAEAVGYTHQVFDHQALLRPVLKATFKAVDGAVDRIVDKAVAIALDPQPGPVHIDVPISLAGLEQARRDPVRRARPSPMAPAPSADLETAQALFAESERPLLLAGLDALNDGASDAVAGFCRDNGVPLITSYKAKGILPEDDSLALGGAGLSPQADRILMPLIEAADCIVCAGYDPIEMRAGWCDPWNPAKVVEFVSVANTHYVHQSRCSFIGNVGKGLASLGRRRHRPGQWLTGTVPEARSRLKSFFAGNGHWGPARVVEIVRQGLPRDAVASVDSGAHRILLSQLWECYEPRGLLQSTGLCTMGCALPLAMGYKLANPSRPVVAFTGDAGLEMVLGELATLRDWNLPLIIVVFVDTSLGLIEMKQRGVELPSLGVDFGGTDFAAVASALGGHGVEVGDDSALEQALSAALERDCFSLLACRIPRGAYDGRF